MSASPIDSLYPPNPENVPADLAKASSSYRLHAWLAMFGLLVFGMVYLALTGWFGWSAYRIFSEIGGHNDDLFTYLKGGCAVFITLFLVKGLFFKRGSGVSKDFEITREQQPDLFEFLDRLAADTKAPRPHKVFLSPDVNACVFYDLSILSFILPSRKNLNIGLGLVNNLTLTEFKAVLAHEFGHFAQNSMAVGRWVYIAQQVATQLIFHRDMFDSFLNGLSRFDLRVAWIGWLLRLVVWSIRSILDTALSGVMLAQRALSREMEFQADLVAVSMTGSDALIHALHRLSPADGAWEETQGFIGQELEKGHATEDIFAIQSRILELRRWVLNDEDFGASPVLPENDREENRVFTVDLAQPPQMWATHPQNHLREENTKKTYVPCELCSESAWKIFTNPEELRQTLTSHLLEEFKKPVRPLAESLEALNKDYEKHSYNPAYRGVYLGRSIVDSSDNVAALYSKREDINTSELYPEELTDLLEKYRNLSKEEGLLTALRDRHYEPADGVIRFRGDIIKRSDLGEALETVKVDLDDSDQKLEEHDRSCRSYAMDIAREMDMGWPAYLQGCLSILHFSDHSLRNLVDANQLLQNTLAVALADGNVSEKEASRLLKDGHDLYRCLMDVHERKKMVVLSEPMRKRFKGKAWAETFEECKLPPVNRDNLGDWLDAIGGWCGELASALSDLQDEALEQLIDTETLLAQHKRENTKPSMAPAPPQAPAGYKTLVKGNERKLQTKLNWWDSFQTASGPVAATARFLCAALLLAGAIYITLPEDLGNRPLQGRGLNF